jgi:hypothetical protein
VIFVGDQQAINWPAEVSSSVAADLPDLQIVQTSVDKPENAWVSDLRVPEGLADVETPTPIVATIRYEGAAPRNQVEVSLAIDRVPVDSKTIDLEPGQAREVTFLHQFEATGEAGRPTWATAGVSLPADRLAEDDTRYLVVPVVAGVPVVFVDQLGDDEDLTQGKLGETYRLRRLLAPTSSRSDRNKPLVRVRHVRIDEVNRDLLQDARLVVIAGIDSPGAAAPLLREYVEQGGPLMIAAGAEFDPAAWNAAAWLNGHGVLPAPLKHEFLGQRPAEATAGALEPFGLEPASMLHPYFRIDDVAEQDLIDLYREPLFFQAVVVDTSDEALRPAIAAEAARLEQERKAGAATTKTDINQHTGVKADTDHRTATNNSAATANTPTSKTAATNVPPAAKSSASGWLAWATPAVELPDSETPIAELAERVRPQILARFTNRTPFIVERRIGRGQVLFVASSVQSDWNTLTTTSAVLVFDRMLRMLIDDTLPRRNFMIDEALRLPIDPRQRRLRFTLISPSGPDEPLTVDAVSGEAYAIALPTLASRGVYRVTGHRAEAETIDEQPVFEASLAINGPQLESQLQMLDAATLATRLGRDSHRFVASGDELTLDGAHVVGKRLWAWFMCAVLGILLCEMGILGWPRLRERAD